MFFTRIGETIDQFNNSLSLWKRIIKQKVLNKVIQNTDIRLNAKTVTTVINMGYRLKKKLPIY